MSTPDGKQMPTSIDLESIAALECETIHRGFDAVDVMAKTAPVRILAAEPIPPGRFLIVIGGGVGEVDSAYRRGLAVAGPLHDQLFLPQVHPTVLEALRTGPRPGQVDTRGLFETGSASACLDAADRGAKGAQVRLIQIHLTKGIAGKSFGLFEGRQDMVEAALQLAEERARSHGRHVGITLLARPDQAVIDRVLAARWGYFGETEIL
jgi:microcompartment protein CcmL/EutN